MNAKIKDEQLFAVIAFMAGILLIFLIPPMCSPDENSHYINAYSLARGIFFPTVSSDGYMGRMLPQSLIDFVETYNHKFAGHLDVQYTFAEAHQNLTASESFGNLAFYDYWNADLNLLAYLPSGFAIFLYLQISKLLPSLILSNGNLLLVGRFGNLIFFITAMYFAIKRTPYKKSTLLMALLPMSIALASTLSYDTVVISMTALLFARLSDLLQSDRRVCTADIAVFAVRSFFLFNVKMVYAAFLLCLFAVPIRRFIDRKQYARSIVIVGASGLLPFLLFRVLFRLLVNKKRWYYYSFLHQQSLFLRGHLFSFCLTILHSFRQYASFYFLSFVGDLGQLDYLLPVSLCLLLCFILLLVVIIDYGQKPVGFLLKGANLVALLICLYLTFAGTYIIWTSHEVGIGVNYVSGVQGRYFIPLIPSAGIILANGRLKNKEALTVFRDRISLIFIALSVTYTVMFTFLRYWV